MARRVLLLFLISTTAAWAQGRPRLVFEDEVIKGEVQKPSISIVVSRQNLKEPLQLELKQSFVPEIVDSIERKPF